MRVTFVRNQPMVLPTRCETFASHDMINLRLRADAAALLKALQEAKDKAYGPAIPGRFSRR